MTAAESSPRGAIFVHQVSRSGQVGPLAPWITMAGWAGAAERRYGNGWIVTTEGVLRSADALALASHPARGAQQVVGRRRRVPEPMVTLAKDARRVVHNRRFRGTTDLDRWREVDVQFVMQLHGLFCDGGLALADHLRVPSVLVVDACQVEEARSWGVTRPGWASIAERLGERPQLREADLVACVSEEVAASVARCTGRRSGVEVVPNGVDTDLFSPGPADPGLRAHLGLEGAFVVGWTGSFRKFHGLETLIEAAALAGEQVPELTLMLVGDGLERPAIEAHAAAMGVRAVFPGTVPFDRIPEHLRVMDVAVALAPSSGPFHYSPVKLREYQATGRAIVASKAGEMARDLRDGLDADVGSSRVDLQACKLEYSIVSPK